MSRFPMDPLLTSAAHALKAGSPLNALKIISLREDAPALALRGIAMAQLEEFGVAKMLLKRAARAFAPYDAVARARCLIALAEIAFVSRDLSWPIEELDKARALLEQRGDKLNAAHANHLKARRALLLGKLGESERAIRAISSHDLPPARRTAHALIEAGIATRRLQISEARLAFNRARDAARLSKIPALIAEVENSALVLVEPAARLITKGKSRLLRLEDVEKLMKKRVLIIDACRRAVRLGSAVVPLLSRPVLFSLLRTLAEAWPGDVSRETLAANAFQAKRVDDSQRARLRVEIGRLRKLTQSLLDVRASPGGFAMRPRTGGEVHVLAWPNEENEAAVLALLSDGEAWSSSSLALALGVSTRTVVRSLQTLADSKKIQWFGLGRARRWTLQAIPSFTTILLLPAPFESD
jgi:hypothetical protein